MGAETHAKAKDLLADALTLPKPQREAYVRARSDDEAVVAEVLELLALDGDDPIAPIVFPLVEEPDIVGTQVGPYRVLDTVGGGGQGEVYVARDTGLHRKVALKRLLPSGTASDERAAVIREARAAAQVTHPHVATIHHVIEHDARMFIVMEFVEGESLAAVLARGRLPMASVWRIGRELVSAVAAAHTKGVIHRDLKPGNIQVLRDGSIKVLDFGIAGINAALTRLTSAKTRETSREGQPGTPGYMAPEQVSSTRFDERSDIFNLGILLFEMATGTRAYEERESDALLAAAARRLPRADEVAPDVPRGLADVIERATEIDPSKRYQTAVALGAAIEAAAPGPAPGPSIGQMLVRAAGAVAVTAVLITACGLLINAVFNLATGRYGAFGREPLAASVVLGLKSLFLPTISIGAMLAGLWAGRFVVGALAAIPPVGSVVQAVSGRRRALASRLRLDRPAEFSQAMVALGMVWLVVVAYAFSDLLRACMSQTISSVEAERLTPLRYDLRFAPSLYRLSLEALVLVLGLSLGRIRRLRSGVTTARGAVAPLVVLLAITVFMLEAPYRLLWNNATTEYSLAGERCYQLGESETHFLLYCPDLAPPRNQEVPKNDSRLRIVGPVESIFRPHPQKGP